MKKIPILFLLFASIGCSQYTAAQIELVSQARRGVEVCKQSQASRRQMIDQAQKLQRYRLDKAFDADIRERENPSAEWVLEHHQAYSAASMALQEQRDASIEADAIERSNLDAIDHALQKVLELQNVQSNIAKTVEGKP